MIRILYHIDIFIAGLCTDNATRLYATEKVRVYSGEAEGYGHYKCWSHYI